LARLDQTVAGATSGLDSYDAYSASGYIETFISDLSLWYVRRSRDRVGPAAENSSDKAAFYDCIYWTLLTVSRIIAPFLPYLSEEIHTNLTNGNSVHLTDWPKSKKLTAPELQLITDMEKARKVVELVLAVRKEQQLKVRQPLRQLRIYAPFKLTEEITALILDETNIKTAVWLSADAPRVEIDTVIDPELAAEGQLRELIRQVQEARKQAGIGISSRIVLKAPLPTSPELAAQLQRKTLAAEIIQSDTISVSEYSQVNINE